MRALLAQLASVPGQTQANAERAVAALAAHPKVDVAVFPELFLGGYDLARAANAAGARLLRASLDRRRRGSIVDGSLYNSVACIDRDGSLAGVYRRTRLFGAEPDVFEPGDEQLIVRLAGLDLGPLICVTTLAATRSAATTAQPTARSASPRRDSATSSTRGRRELTLRRDPFA